MEVLRYTRMNCCSISKELYDVRLVVFHIDNKLTDQTPSGIIFNEFYCI